MPDRPVRTWKLERDLGSGGIRAIGPPLLFNRPVPVAAVEDLVEALRAHDVPTVVIGRDLSGMPNVRKPPRPQRPPYIPGHLGAVSQERMDAFTATWAICRALDAEVGGTREAGFLAKVGWYGIRREDLAKNAGRMLGGDGGSDG